MRRNYGLHVIFLQKRVLPATPWVTLACLAYIMLGPVGHNSVLLPVLALFAITSTVTLAAYRRRPRLELVIVVAAVVAVGIYGAFIGLGNPGVGNGALVWIVAPMMFGVWAFSGSEWTIRVTLWTSAIVTIASSAVMVLYVIGKVIHYPLLPPFVIAQGGFAFSGSTDLISFSSYGLSTLAAATPIWLTASLLPKHVLLPAKTITVAAGAFGLVVTLLSARAALMVTAVTIPLIVWVVWRVLSRRMHRDRWQRAAPLVVGVVASAGIAGLLLTTTIITRTWSRLIGSFTGDYATLDDKIRGEESIELIQGWLHAPIFGHGWGAIIEGYARSARRPWNFELQYHLILFQVGIIGSLVLLTAVGIAIYAFIRALQKRPDLTPILLITAAGAAALLAANYSNPYLQAPGNMWPVYLVLMVTNVALARDQTSASNARAFNFLDRSRAESNSD